MVSFAAWTTLLIVWICQRRLFFKVLCGQERKQIPFQDVLRSKILSNSVVLEKLEKSQKVNQTSFANTNIIAPSLCFSSKCVFKRTFHPSKLFTLLVALALWELKEKAIYFRLSVTISIVTNLRFFSKRGFGEILVLFHSVPHLVFPQSWKTSKVPTHLTFSRKKSFFENLAVSRNLCSLFPFAFSQNAEVSMFFPFKIFWSQWDFFSYHS